MRAAAGGGRVDMTAVGIGSDTERISWNCYEETCLHAADSKTHQVRVRLVIHSALGRGEPDFQRY